MLKSISELDSSTNIRNEVAEIVNPKLLRTVETPKAKQALTKALERLSMLQQTQAAFTQFLGCIPKLLAVREKEYVGDIQAMIKEGLSEVRKRSPLIGTLIRCLLNPIDWETVLKAEVPSLPKKSNFRKSLENHWIQYSRSLHKRPIFCTEEQEVIDMACLFEQLSSCLNIPHGGESHIISDNNSDYQSDDKLVKIVESILSYDGESLSLRWLGFSMYKFENFHKGLREIDNERRLENESVAREKAENQLRYQHSVLNILKALGLSEIVGAVAQYQTEDKADESNQEKTLKPSLGGIRYRFLNRDGHSDAVNVEKLSNGQNIL